MQRNGLIKALPFHKHLPVMKVMKDRARERERESERARERERERERPSERPRKVARACEPASARLSLQAMRLSYFKNVSGYSRNPCSLNRERDAA